MRTPKGRAAVTAAALAVSAITAAGLAAPAQAAPGAPRDTPHGKRGRLLTQHRATGAAALPSAARTEAVSYVSEGVGGRRVTVSGTVAVPRGRAPHGGWPVISWTHGTTGTADRCAPSADTADGPAHDYLSITERYLDGWVARGYAVVQTDYEGLGTPGGHPYMHGASEANAALDIVRAARRVHRGIGRNWFVIGHSQGGQAALFTAAARRAGDVRLRGAVAIAPGSHMAETAAYVQGRYPGAEAALPFLFVLLNGAQAADPSIVPEDLLTDRAAELAKAGRTTACLAQLRQQSATLPLDQVFRPGANLKPFEDYLRSQEALGLTLNVPTLVAQGTADKEVSPAATQGIVADLCKRSPTIAYRTYPGADHRASIQASFEDALHFTKTVLAGKTPPTTC